MGDAPLFSLLLGDVKYLPAGFSVFFEFFWVGNDKGQIVFCGGVFLRLVVPGTLRSSGALVAIILFATPFRAQSRYPGPICAAFSFFRLTKRLTRRTLNLSGSATFRFFQTAANLLVPEEALPSSFFFSLPALVARGDSKERRSFG